ncbi:MAG: aminotransferase class V-fold PLP-dependent enzyme [Planctomycetota bacterium]|nr:MAG: aminotransferase class V-fold PLP-dependent enzyme [Planctomycetota bacterium]
MRRLVELAMERIERFLRELPTQPAAQWEGGGEVARALQEPLPEEGAPFPQLLDRIFQEAVPHSFNTAGPGYLAFVPGGGIFPTAVADLIGDVVNRYVGVWLAAPGMVQLEQNVIRWFCQIVGLPAGAGGVLTTGGSMANFTAIVAARRDRLPEDFLAGTIYTSDQVHHSVTKAAVLAGFPEERVRVLPSDERYRLRPAAVAAAVAEDRAAGLRPFLLVGSAGTTNSGAVDPLPELAALARREGLWFHVDAAYGGFFALTERGRAALAGLGEADSLSLDPHKGMFLPYGTGSLLVRDPATLRRAHATSADYMPPYQDDPDRADFCALSPELSRDNRGLRVWLPARLLGFRAWREALDEKLDLAHLAARELGQVPGVEILAEPVLSLFAFRLAPAGTSEEERERLNREWLERVNRRRRVYLTATRLRGRFALRMCVLHFRTHRERIEMALEDLRQEAEILSRRPAGRQSVD